MTHYLEIGNVTRPHRNRPGVITERLEAATYMLAVDPDGFLLVRIEDFELPSKMYGSHDRHRDRILNTFADRDGSTGVLLVGEKGSGKTLLAKDLSITARAAGVPTIIVNQPFCGDGFNAFLASIDQPCMIMFDEFEKIYKTEDQEKLLTLFDGVFSTKRLFVLTSNDISKTQSHMRNRPGRIYYVIQYKGLDARFITEYCDDNLTDKSQISSINLIGSLFADFNFDMLKALVQEMNRYGESAMESIKMLNCRIEWTPNRRYDLKMSYDGKTVTRHSLGRSVSFQPLGDTLNFYARIDKDAAAADGLTPDSDGDVTFVLNDANLLSFENGRLTYQRGKLTVILDESRDGPSVFDKASDMSKGIPTTAVEEIPEPPQAEEGGCDLECDCESGSDCEATRKAMRNGGNVVAIAA